MNILSYKPVMNDQTQYFISILDWSTISNYVVDFFYSFKYSHVTSWIFFFFLLDENCAYIKILWISTTNFTSQFYIYQKTNFISQFYILKIIIISHHNYIYIKIYFPTYILCVYNHVTDNVHMYMCV